MTVIKASCPLCGEVELPPAAVSCTDGPGGWYSFTCNGGCGEVVRKPAGDDICALLRTGGVRIEHVPTEVWETHPDTPMTTDDLIELWAEIQRMETA